VILHAAPQLFLEALRRRDHNLLGLALDLCVPPLALLMLLTLTVFVGSAVFYWSTKLALPLWLSAMSLLMLGLSVLLAWGSYGRQVISLASLASAPFYALWKLPLYVRFMVKRQAEWIRSRRDSD
jgi:hypothetical protein